MTMKSEGIEAPLPSWVPAKRGDHEPVSVLTDASKASKDEQEGSETKRKVTIDFNKFDSEFKEQNLKNKTATTVGTRTVAELGSNKEQEHMSFTTSTEGSPTVIFHTVGRREAQESNPRKQVVTTQDDKAAGMESPPRNARRGSSSSWVILCHGL